MNIPERIDLILRSTPQKRLDAVLNLYGDKIQSLYYTLPDNALRRLVKYRCALCFTRVAKLEGVSMPRIAQELARVTKRLLHPTRLTILRDLMAGDPTTPLDDYDLVCELLEYHRNHYLFAPPTRVCAIWPGRPWRSRLAIKGVDW